MATLSAANQRAIWTIQEHMPELTKPGVLKDELQKLEASLPLIETQLKFSQNLKDTEYLNNLLVYTNYAICALKYRSY